MRCRNLPLPRARRAHGHRVRHDQGAACCRRCPGPAVPMAAPGLPCNPVPDGRRRGRPDRPGAARVCAANLPPGSGAGGRRREHARAGYMNRLSRARHPRRHRRRHQGYQGGPAAARHGRDGRRRSPCASTPLPRPAPMPASLHGLRHAAPLPRAMGGGAFCVKLTPKNALLGASLPTRRVARREASTDRSRRYTRSGVAP